MLRTRVTLLLLAACLPAPALADGLYMKNGRYAGGPATVLNLSPNQQLTVKTARVVVLTSAQKALLSKEAGVAPTVLVVRSVKLAELDCTCGAYNLGVWIEPSRIQAPHKYLVSDAEAEKRAEGNESVDSQ